MHLTQFFYLNENFTRVYCHNKFCNYPKKTKYWIALENILKDSDNMTGIGYQYYLEKTGTKVTHKKLK